MGILAGAILLSGYSVFKLVYIARPDMLQGALLCAAWALGTGVLARAARGERGGGTRWRALLMWFCIGLAALAKGPPAVLAVLYLPLAARLIYGRWSLVNATGWWWGLPLAAAMYAAWLVPVARVAPDHFRTVLVGDEVVRRVVGQGIGEILSGIWKIPVYFFGRFMPWSAIAALALIRIRPRRWRSHPLAPGILWLLLILLAYSCSAGKLSRYLLPVYPAAAALAGWWLVDLWRKHRWIVQRIAVAALLVAIGQGVHWWTLARPARTGYGEAIKDFAAEVRPIVGDQPVVFRTGWCDILPPLLARHQAGAPTPEQLAAARWEIVTWRAKSPRGEPVVRSRLARQEGDLRLALYRRPPPRPSAVRPTTRPPRPTSP
jgi:4-amino-4-deoxy-L-arabinose transferase-like glycosyltransferase